jgi:hypothetical protein
MLTHYMNDLYLIFRNIANRNIVLDYYSIPITPIRHYSGLFVFLSEP